MKYLLIFILVVVLCFNLPSINANQSNESKSCSNSANKDEECNAATSNRKTVNLSEEELLRQIKEYGVEQEVEGREKKQTLEIIKSSLEYMKSSNIRNCKNEFKLCAFWASIGECEENPNMKNICGPSCLSCEMNLGLELNSQEEAILREIQEFGIAQDIKGGNKAEILKVIQSSLEYMKNIDSEISIKKEIRDSCRNKQALCAFWATIGECEANPGYMKVSCAPSCKTCDLIDFDARCPKRDPSIRPSLQPGDLNKLFERIVTQLDYNVTILSQPSSSSSFSSSIISAEQDAASPPWVITINNFLSHEECDTLISLGQEQGYERSRDVGPKDFDGTYKPLESSGRTSKNAWCSKECREHAVVQTILERIEYVTQIPQTNYEDFQILQYHQGEFYKQHHDFIPHQVDRACGPRVLTFFQYLSDVEEGGGTGFPLLDLEVMPEKGKVLLWPSSLNSDPEKKDGRMDHEALPVIQGVKYGANAWIHLYDYRTPQENNCS